MPSGIITVRFPSQKAEPNHGTLTRYNRPHECRCPECSDAKLRSDAGNIARTNLDLLAQATRAGHPLPPLPPTYEECQECGGPLPGERRYRRFCSDAHARRAQRRG